MNTGGRLIAGSHNRNEFVLINADENARIRSLQELSGQTCQICGDDIELSVNGELFVACNECAFPVCRPCYEYERREGNQACPQCKTRYKRIKGSPRVQGDDEEDDDDDLDLDHDGMMDPELVAEAALSSRLNTGRGGSPGSQIPLLTYGDEDDDMYSDRHALILPPSTGYGNRVHPAPFTDSSYAPSQARSMVPQKDIAEYGYGSVAWKDRMEVWKKRQAEKLHVIKHDVNDDEELDDPDMPMMDEGRQPLSRKLPIRSSRINPYRMLILCRLAILCLFFHYRILHPVNDAYGLWLTSVVCEIWFAVSWILDQFPKWYPIQRETYLDRLSLRYEKEGQPSGLAPVDVFVSTVDPLKEPPLITANTVLSILAVDYPVDKVACYVSDDGAAMLTFEALSDTAEFARKWVPFCKKFSIEPRAPEWYFCQKMDYLKNKVHPSFVRERRAMKNHFYKSYVLTHSFSNIIQMAGKEDSETFYSAATPLAFELGSLPTTVIPADPSATDLTAPPKPVIITSPTVAGTYPVVLFFHGFYLRNYFYSDVINHVASHGYIVVAPQLCKILPPGGQVEVDDAGKVINWTSKNLKAHLPSSVNANGNYTALVGHSRGGKTAFAVALGHAATLDPSIKFSALVGIDPVAGISKCIRTDPEILTYKPESFDLDMPVAVIGTGLGPKSNMLMPPCAPAEVNHEEFYIECKATKGHFVAADYGHMDMLDDNLPGFVGFMAGCMCKNSKRKKSEMRSFVGGIVVAFLKYSLLGEKSEIRQIVKDPSVSPARLDPLPELEEASGYLV